MTEIETVEAIPGTGIPRLQIEGADNMPNMTMGAGIPGGADAYIGGLPEIEDACDLMEREGVLPLELIAGVLHQGAKLVLGGGSKSFKTWSLLDMAISVATGTDWWGFNTHQGHVLYVNFEIQKPFFAARLREVQAAKKVNLMPGQLHTHNLRGHAADADIVIPMIEDKMKSNSYALVVIDPLYKLLGSKDENATRDMAAIMNRLETLAVNTGAAVVFGSHFAKGNASGKESMDRISGSGVFARDPDAILTMTAHETDGAFTVDLTLRNNKPQEPFVVRRLHPLMIRDEVLDPAKLKTKPGRKTVVEADELLVLLDEEPLSSKDWQEKAEAVFGIKRTAFLDKTKKLREDRKVTLNQNSRYERSNQNCVPIINFLKEDTPVTVG
jgi:hypothetical protein